MQGTPEDPSKTVTEGSTDPSVNPDEEVCLQFPWLFLEMFLVTCSSVNIELSSFDFFPEKNKYLFASKEHYFLHSFIFPWHVDWYYLVG